MVHKQLLWSKKQQVLLLGAGQVICEVDELCQVDLVLHLSQYSSRLYDPGSNCANPLLVADQQTQINWNSTGQRPSKENRGYSEHLTS